MALGKAKKCEITNGQNQKNHMNKQVNCIKKQLKNKITMGMQAHIHRHCWCTFQSETINVPGLPASSARQPHLTAETRYSKLEREHAAQAQPIWRMLPSWKKRSQFANHFSTTRSCSASGTIF
mmetsp:Transcript_152377/g.280833  ORF Transcript_152377/g.280833 Transcript_152377/m.280833 type:complete len:123 (+) Transcript_152377:136-504(+)